MARKDPQVNVRLPASLKQRIEMAAAESGRSFTAEVVIRLQQSLTGAFVDLSSEGFGALIKRLEATVETSDVLFLRLRDQIRALEGKEPNSGAVEIPAMAFEQLQDALEKGETERAKAVLDDAVRTQLSSLRTSDT
ncbi:Arc family DNA-binding protein [Pseudohoeflea suaedae]|uniref:Arc family DNA-binding protein n=1 Tax=Pseudohoeflea suaedae TaxID=877384 RepID=A0A4R5PNE1_9HYPH|nr:Arc family DNA-binding protein [Pseudohoeflea suaedae]TDH38562.1 Arc family DNA-binding protein [Pseudohoeflea suaedae]